MALYNGGYPVSYQQMYPQYQQPTYSQPNPQSAQNSSIIWVQGEAGAKAYIVAPNTTVQLWDSDAQVIYLKSADASGMPSLKVLDYTIRTQDTQKQPVSALRDEAQYATREELDEIIGQINTLKTQLEKMKKPKIKVVEEDE